MTRSTRTPRGQRIPVALPEESRSTAWIREFRPSGFALGVLALVVGALVVLAPSLKNFVEQRQEIARLEAAVREAQADVDQLEAEIARWDDPAYIEAQARDRLYYVFPGDRSYLVIGDDGIPASSEELPISDQIQTTRVDWLRALLGSVFEAGLTELTPSELDESGNLDSPRQRTDG